jgi:predicted nucleic-acid-binding protein
MIAIDTNVLLRYLLCDDEEQSVKADKLINGTTPVLITDVVLTETLWTLKGKKYKLDKASIVEVVNALFEEQNICFEDGQTVWRSLNDYRQAKPGKVGSKKKEADFPDALIVNKARFLSAEKGEPFDGVYTFDLAAQVLPGTKQP